MIACSVVHRSEGCQRIKRIRQATVAGAGSSIVDKPDHSANGDRSGGRITRTFAVVERVIKSVGPFKTCWWVIREGAVGTEVHVSALRAEESAGGNVKHPADAICVGNVGQNTRGRYSDSNVSTC